MKTWKNIIAGGMAVVFMSSAMTVPVSAAVENTPKEEAVYINLHSDGSIEEMYVVNIFKMEEAGTITDYGKYESMRNMTSTDSIAYQDETVTIETEQGNLYYEGQLKDYEMPWNISIHYYMDGKEYTAQEIAGMSGKLKITMDITENTSCVSNFYEGFALQASVLLDSENCKNIKAEGATIANVGSDKQLTYTILPDTGANVVIEAEVEEFEMQSIAINGIKMSLNMEIDDTQIQEKVEELTEPVGELDNGASSLLNGSAELKEGLDAIAAQNSTLTNGAYTAFAGLCNAAASALNTQLAEYGMEAVALTPDNYASVLTGLLNSLGADQAYEAAYAQALAEVTAQVAAQQEVLYAGYIEQNAETFYLAYVQSQAEMIFGEAFAYMTAEEQEQAILAAAASLTEEQKAQIQAGAVASLTEEQKTQIREGYIAQMMGSDEVTSQLTAATNAVNAAAASVADLKGQLDSFSAFYQGLNSYTSAVSNAASGATALHAGISELKDGTETFVEETDGMHETISEEIDSMVSSVSGEEVELVSFVSEKNTNIESVQFVIQTDAIEMEKVEEVQEAEDVPLTFWQKLLKLFGL